MATDRDPLLDALSGPPASVEMQLVYKIASLESSVLGMAKRLDEKLDRVYTELMSKHADLKAEQAKIDSRIEAEQVKSITKFDLQDRRLDSLEDWRKAVTIRITGIIGIAFSLWAVFGDYLKHMLGLGGV